MNILTDEIEDAAEWVKLKILSRGGSWSLYASAAGKLDMMQVAGNVVRKYDLPDDDLVGTYTRKAKTSDIEDDLICRYAELTRRRVA